MSTAAEYLALTKPRLLPLVLFSGANNVTLSGGSFEMLNFAGIVKVDAPSRINPRRSSRRRP